MTDRGPLWLFWVIALIACGVAASARLSYDVNRSQDPRSGEWVSLEPDSFYHMRRAQRFLLEDGAVAGSDALLDFPDGAEIPWPPYYTVLLGTIAGAVGVDLDVDGGWLELERLVATVPLVFGCLTVLLAAWAARRISGNLAAAVAAMATALALGPVTYAGIGNGDHHAFVSFLHVAVLLALTLVLQTGALERPRPALLAGAALGVVIGLGLGSWVAFMAYLIEVELVLAVLLFQQRKRPLIGLRYFGAALHVAALVTLLPAVMQSPWQAVEPWSVVNLSLFHPFFLLVGTCVFLPLFAPAVERRLVRTYPWFVGVALAILFGSLLWTGLGPGTGLQSAFSWASREDQFMASIHESSSVFDDLGVGLRQLLLSTGHLLWLAPLALGLCLFSLWRGSNQLLPWCVALPLLLVQALFQLRFAEALVAPASVVVGCGIAACHTRFLSDKKGLRFVVPFLGLLIGTAIQQPGVLEMVRYTEHSAGFAEATEFQQRHGAERRMGEWLRERPMEEGREAVLASWGAGHMIEWVAQRPTIATNFGSYLGEESYSFGPRVFMCEDDAALERLLAERQIGYLLLGSRQTEMLPDLIARAEILVPEQYLVGLKKGWKGGLRPRWFHTTLARLLLAGSETSGGQQQESRAPFGFLRLVHVAPEMDPEPALRGVVSRSARGWIWERVPGARLSFHGTAGSNIGVRFAVRYEGSQLRLDFEMHGVIGEEGRGELRVPYTTSGENGSGRVLPGAVYWIGVGDRRLVIPADAVLQGSTVDLR